MLRRLAFLVHAVLVLHGHGLTDALRHDIAAQLAAADPIEGVPSVGERVDDCGQELKRTSLAVVEGVRKPPAAASPIEGVSIRERVHDYWQKLKMARTVVKDVVNPFGRFSVKTEYVRGVPVKVFRNIPDALGPMYTQYMRQFAEREWLVYQEERITFAQAENDMVAIAAALLHNHQVKRGDRVGIAMPNLPEFMISYLAITFAGAVAVPLNALWKSEELEYAIKDAGLKLMFTDSVRLEVCQPFMQHLGVKAILVKGDPNAVQEEAGVTASWQDVLQQGRNLSAPTHELIKPEDEAMIMYTSGSTGFPKGVVHTQRSVASSIKLGELSAKLMPEQKSVALMAVPMFHITALANTFLWSLSRGNSVIMMRKWNAGEALRLVEEEKATRFLGVPTMVKDMFEHADFSPEKFATMKSLAAGGAPVPPSLVAQMRKKSKSAAASQGYGLTETMGGVIANTGVDYLNHPTSCGRPIPLLVEAVIKDPVTKEVLPAGARGELCIKSVFNMKGYNNRASETRKAIDSEGFFHTGDIAKIEGGFVYILDRLKDIIIRGGENIDCSEVEAALSSVEGVREVAVFGVKDDRLGEVVGAAVYATTDVNAADLSEHCRDKLARFKVPLPEHIFIVKEPLPKIATGKINKNALRSLYSGK